MELVFHGSNNTRDLGGIKTKDGRQIAPGRLIRSGTLCRMNASACRLLETQYRVKTMIDLRTPDEIGRHPLPKALKIPVVNVSLSEKAMLGIVSDSASIVQRIRAVVAAGMTETEFMEQTYRNLIVGKAAIAGYREIFDILLHTPDGAVLFSCAQGRDRTGMTAMMILSALGVSVVDIMDDYMIAPPAEREYFLISMMKNLHLASPDESAFAKAFASPSLSRFRYAMHCLEEEYGSVHTYLTSAVGLKDVEIDKLREMYLL